MSEHSEVRQIYLSQLQGLEEFRAKYQSAFSTAALDRDDPELKRLTEAIAYCSAHSQQRNLDSLRRHEQNLLAQIHPYMITPLPAKAIIEMKISSKMKESYLVDAGTPFVLQDENLNSALFKSCYSLSILPIQFSHFGLSEEGLSWLNLDLRFDAFSQIQAPLQELPFYINVCNDFTATLALLNSLKHAETRIEVKFDNDDSQVVPCKLACRQPEFMPGMHPVETIRNLLHFPYIGFCCSLIVEQAPSHWHSFKISIRLEKQTDLEALTKDCFRPFCTPLVNLHQANTQNIWCDGTRSQYPVISDDADLDVHSISGVFQHIHEEKIPLLPSIIRQTDNTYYLSRDIDRQWSLDLNINEAFESPRMITVGANWHDPKFSTSLWQKLSVVPYKMDIPGVDFSLNEARQVCASIKSYRDTLTWDLLGIHGHEVVSAYHLNQLFFVFSTQIATEFDVVKKGFRGITAGLNPSEFGANIRFSNESVQTVDLFFSYFEALVNDWFEKSDIHLHIIQENNPS